MNYIQRNLIPLTVGLLAVVAIIIVAGTVIVRLSGSDEISDEEFARELDRRFGGSMRGSATLGVALEADLRITAVVPGGAAEAAGIRLGDQLVAVNSAEVKSIDEARTRIAAVPANSEYTVTVLRQGARVDLKVHKGAPISDLGGLFQRFMERGPFGRDRGGAGPEAPPPGPASPSAGPVLGVALEPAAGGVRVVSVTPNSAAAAAGVQVDDVIVTANGRATPSTEALQAILRTAGPGASVSLEVKRGDRQMTLTATLGPRT